MKSVGRVETVEAESHSGSPAHKQVFKSEVLKEGRRATVGAKSYTCEECGEEFDTPQGLGGHSNLHTDYSHSEETKRKIGEANEGNKGLKGEKNPNWTGFSELVEVDCAYCGNTLERIRGRVENRSENFFCGDKDCHPKWQSEKRSGKLCGENNPNYGNSFSLSEERVREMSENRMGDGNPMFGVTGEDHHLYRGGRVAYTPKFNEELRECIRKRDTRRCRSCGKNGEANGRKLNVHHLDRNKANNLVTNLMSVCDSCHRKLEPDNRVDFFEEVSVVG